MGGKPRKKPVKVLTCTRPDRDAAKLICGYPLPCPHHTIVITEGQLFGALDKLRVN